MHPVIRASQIFAKSTGSRAFGHSQRAKTPMTFQRIANCLVRAATLAKSRNVLSEGFILWDVLTSDPRAQSPAILFGTDPERSPPLPRRVLSSQPESMFTMNTVVSLAAGLKTPLGRAFTRPSVTEVATASHTVAAPVPQHPTPGRVTGEIKKAPFSIYPHLITIRVVNVDRGLASGTH